MDFSLTTNQGYLDIDWTVTENKNLLIINSIFEKARCSENIAKLQPIFQRGGSIKDIVFNINGFSGGSLLWYYVKVYQDKGIPFIKINIDSILTNLVKQKIIESYSNLSVVVQNRVLYLRLDYKVNEKTFNLNLTNGIDF